MRKNYLRILPVLFLAGAIAFGAVTQKQQPAKPDGPNQSDNSNSACKEPLDSAEFSSSQCAAPALTAFQKQFRQQTLAKLKQKFTTQAVEPLRAELEKHFVALEQKTEKLNDLELADLLKQWIEKELKSRTYLPGLNPKPGHPKTLDGIVESFVKMDKASADHEDSMMHIMGNLSNLPLMWRDFSMHVLTDIATGDTKSIEGFEMLLDSCYDMIVLEKFKRRLRDGQWTAIENPELKKSYQSHVNAPTYTEKRQRLLQSRSWQNLEVVTGKIVMPQ